MRWLLLRFVLVAFLLAVGAFLLLVFFSEPGGGNRSAAAGEGPSEDELARRIVALEALPYLASVTGDTPDVNGVTVHDADRAWRGLNVLTSLNAGGAFLLDMEGRVVHEWTMPEGFDNKWQFAELDSEGRLWVLVPSAGLVQLDWESNVLRFIPRSSDPLYAFHHDFDVLADGSVLLLVSVRFREIPISGVLDTGEAADALAPIREHAILGFDQSEELVEQVSFTELTAQHIADRERNWLVALVDRDYTTEQTLTHNASDVHHPNTIEALRVDLGVARKGHLLFCTRNQDLIGIIDRVSGELLWGWGPGIIDRPHHPTALENGNVLLFDNGAITRDYSRVLEVDPSTGSIVWEYAGDPKFYSRARGRISVFRTATR